MLALRTTQSGFSLIELIIGMAILSSLLAIGIPAFSGWIQNTQVRTATESILNGLQLARSEAVRRNAPVRLNLTDATGGVAWSVDCVNVTADCPAAIQTRSASEGGGYARAGASVAALPTPIPTTEFATVLAAGTDLPAGITFDNFGRVPLANIGTDIAWLNVISAASSSARRMVIIVGTGGQIRMCDPALTLATNPQGCA